MASFSRLRVGPPSKLIFLSLALLCSERCGRVATANSLPMQPLAAYSRTGENAIMKGQKPTEQSSDTILSFLGAVTSNGRQVPELAHDSRDLGLGFCNGPELLLSSSVRRLHELPRQATVCPTTERRGNELRPIYDVSHRSQGRRGGSERSPSAGTQSTMSSLGGSNLGPKGRSRGFGSRLMELPFSSGRDTGAKPAVVSSPSALNALVTPGIDRMFFDSSEEEEEEGEEEDMFDLWGAAIAQSELRMKEQWASVELEQQRVSLQTDGSKKVLSLRELGLDEAERGHVVRPPDQWRVNPGFVEEEEGTEEEEEEMHDMYVLSHPSHIRALSPLELARAGVVSPGQQVEAVGPEGCKRVVRRDGESILALARFEGMLLAGGTDEVAVWDVETLEKVGSLRGHTGWVNCLTLDAARRRLFTGADDGTVRVWDLDSLECTAQLSGQTGPVLALAVSADGKELYVGGEGLEVWDLQKQEAERRLKHTLDELCTADRVRVRQMASFDTSSVRNKGKFSSLSMAASQRVGSRRVGAIGVVGGCLLSGMQDGSVWIWDTSSYGVAGCLLDAPRHSKAHAGPLEVVGGMVLHGSMDGAIRAYDSASFELLHTLQAHRGPVLGLTVSEDGKKMVSCGSDGAALEWSLDALKVSRVLQGHQGGVAGASEGAGGDVITACIDGSIRVW